MYDNFLLYISVPDTLVLNNNNKIRSWCLAKPYAGYLCATVKATCVLLWKLHLLLPFFTCTASLHSKKHGRCVSTQEMCRHRMKPFSLLIQCKIVLISGVERKRSEPNWFLDCYIILSLTSAVATWVTLKKNLQIIEKLDDTILN